MEVGGEGDYKCTLCVMFLFCKRIMMWMEFILYFRFLLEDIYIYKAFVGFYLPCVTSFCKMR